MVDDGIELDQSASINKIFQTLKRDTEDVITELCTQDLCTLLDLSYELLKIESQTEPFVYEILNGQVKP